MPRKKSKPEPKVEEKVESKRWTDAFAVGTLMIAVMMLAALFSFDPQDVAERGPGDTHETKNLIGLLGAYGANALFFLLGLTGYLIPPVLVLIGLTFLSNRFAYFRSRWPWIAVFAVAISGLLDLYHPLFSTVKDNLGLVSPGGAMGNVLNRYILQKFLGLIGATIVYSSAYLISMVYLLNIDLKQWVKSLWIKWKAARIAAATRPPEEETEPAAKKTPRSRRKKAVDKEIEELEKEVKEDLKVSASMDPIPEPTIRDGNVAEGEKDDLAIQPSSDLTDSITIHLGDEPAPESEESKVVPPATADEVLGKKPAKKKKGRKKKEENPFSGETAPAPEGEEKTEEEPVAEMNIVDSNEPTPTTDSAESDSSEPDPAKEAAREQEDAETVAMAVAQSKVSKRPRNPSRVEVSEVPTISGYRKPGVEFLGKAEPPSANAETREELMKNARLMQTTLGQFKIEATPGDITRGPTITRYELHPAPGVKLERIVNLSNNLSAALRAERLNILAPIPGKSAVGIEVPNKVKTMVMMRDLLESNEFKNFKGKIPLGLGKDVYGKPVIADLADMPHLLIAGSTGSGKSVCINSIVASLLNRFGPDELRFVMIDPKVVELQQYNVLPHLVVPVVTDPKKVVLALKWVTNEMEKRYKIFAKVGVRNISGFNGRTRKAPKKKEHPELPLEKDDEGFAVELDKKMVEEEDDDMLVPDKLSYIVVIIDELADLMLVAAKEVETEIARITQMARAAGIHCIVATQRPSVDVITGVIKANIPSRIAFQVAAKVDSRTILDAMGADKLLGKGDMLYLPPGSAKLIRSQGALITDEEIQSMVDFIAEQATPSYDMEIHEQLQGNQRPAMEEPECSEDEEMIERCIEVILTKKKASVSILQRMLRLGYGRAARIMDELERRGIVGENNGSGGREILITLDDD